MAPKTLSTACRSPLAPSITHRTAISESEQYYQALRLRKIESVTVRIPAASHGIAARPSNLIAKVAHILKWFNTHGDKQTPAPNDQGATKASP